MLRHRNGKPLVRLYGPANADRRGGTVTVNFYDATGHVVDHRFIEQQANQANISLRTGCFCNPGANEMAHGLAKPELVACFQQPTERLTLDDFRLCIDGKSSGAVRISVGLVTNFSDVYRFMQFAASLVDQISVYMTAP